jgi:alanine-synthesizing transaminase
MIFDLLRTEKILLVHGSAFNIKEGCYFRLVFLPHVEILKLALEGIANFFKSYKQVI